MSLSYQAFCCSELDDLPASTHMIPLWSVQSLQYLMVPIGCYCFLPLESDVLLGHMFTVMAT